jgi:sugar phosphate isomerase/epimerase
MTRAVVDELVEQAGRERCSWHGSGCNRRQFLGATMVGAAWMSCGVRLAGQTAPKLSPKGQNMAYGLVTYMWGAEWTLDELLERCAAADVRGVELRTTHRHGVEPTLTAQQRSEVARKFQEARITLVGLGSNERLDHPEPAALQKAVHTIQEFVRLSHDVGGTGVKVKPDSFHPNVPREKTIEQIGKTLNQLGEFAEGFGQQIRLEVHGQCAELPTIRKILDIATHPNVGICWNSNPQDLQGDGLEANFRLVADRLGATCHVRELDSPNYPYQKLIDLLVEVDYEGWVMLESTSKPEDPVAGLRRQKELFHAMILDARKRLADT